LIKIFKPIENLVKIGATYLSLKGNAYNLLVIGLPPSLIPEKKQEAP